MARAKIEIAEYEVTVTSQEGPIFKDRIQFLAEEDPIVVIRQELLRIFKLTSVGLTEENFDKNLVVKVNKIGARSAAYPNRETFRYCHQCRKSNVDMRLEQQDYVFCGVCGTKTGFLILKTIRWCSQCEVTSESLGVSDEEFAFCGKCGQETGYAVKKA
jgi:NADH pyrophosphatase NudC (nudix superfamily)